MAFQLEVHEKVASKNANHSTPISCSEADVHTLERSISGRMRSEVYSVIATVESRVHDAILTEMESFSNF